MATAKSHKRKSVFASLALTIMGVVSIWKPDRLIQRGGGIANLTPHQRSFLEAAYRLLGAAMICLAVILFLKRNRSPLRRDSSVLDRLRHLRSTTREAFARRPTRTSVRLVLWFVLCGAVPFGLFVPIHPHGWRRLGAGDWLLLGAMEFPVVFVCVVVLSGIWRRGKD